MAEEGKAEKAEKPEQTEETEAKKTEKAEKAEKAKEKPKKKSTLKEFRDKTGIKASEELRERHKKQRQIVKAIKEALKSGPKTIPQIVSETNLESKVVTWHLFTLWKYGEVREVEEVEGYFTYELAEKSE
ncbi:MAG: hypothetical protein H0Z28_05115 [Archaeoglobus sp.]|nr:hypothetical protein [Archaeoglobus sp.]